MSTASSSFIERNTPKVTFTLPKPKSNLTPSSIQFTALCEPAQALHALCEELITPILANPDEISVYTGLLYLQDEWRAHLKAAPAAHQCYSPRKGRHMCVIDVYLAWYDVLDARRRSIKIKQPLWREPPPSPQPEAEPAFPGIYLGVDVGRALGPPA